MVFNTFVLKTILISTVEIRGGCITVRIFQKQKGNDAKPLGRPDDLPNIEFPF